MFLSFTFEFTLIITLGFIGGMIARKLKQPAILGYLLAGLAASLVISPVMSNREAIDAIAEIGVALLLFTVGIELNLSRFKRVFKIAIIGGSIQIVETIIIYKLILEMFGIGSFEALFIAAAFSLSSTAVVVKMLAEKGMQDSLPGEIMTAWLLIQDIAVVPILILLPFFSDKASEMTVMDGVLTVGKAVIFILVLLFVGKRVVEKILSKLAQANPPAGGSELILLATVSLCLIVAFLTEQMGLSFVLGAFFAGVLVAETTEQHEVFNEIRPLRDLFSVIFFVTLSLLVPFDGIVALLPLALAISAVVILFKFVIALFIGLAFKLHSKVAFLIALSIVSVGEFSFVLAREGLDADLISRETYSLILLVTILTIIVTPILFNNAHGIYGKTKLLVKKILPRVWYEFFEKMDQLPYDSELPFENHVVLCGYGRVGRYIGRALETAGIPYVVIEFNRMLVTALRQKGITAVYGDPANRDILDYAQVDKAKLLISAIPDMHTQRMMIRHAKRMNADIHIIGRIHQEMDQKEFKEMGADFLVQPEFSAALDIVERTLKLFSIDEKEIVGKITRLKIEHGETE